MAPLESTISALGRCVSPIWPGASHLPRTSLSHKRQPVSLNRKPPE